MTFRCPLVQFVNKSMPISSFSPPLDFSDMLDVKHYRNKMNQRRSQMSTNLLVGFLDEKADDHHRLSLSKSVYPGQGLLLYR